MFYRTAESVSPKHPDKLCDQISDAIIADDVKILFGEDHINETLLDLRFRIGPFSFFQTNTYSAEVLYSRVREYVSLCGGGAFGKTVYDLYSGTGTIAQIAAASADRVYGVEIIPEAVENAVRNAKRNHITNAEFFVGKAEEILPLHYKNTGERADVIVVDPPRKGCDASLLDTMAAMQPERIVYVSCDSATLARDLKILCEKGYRLEKVCPADQFPMTVHVETVCLLSNRKPDTKVRIDVDLEDYYRIKDAKKNQN